MGILKLKPGQASSFALVLLLISQLVLPYPLLAQAGSGEAYTVGPPAAEGHRVASPLKAYSETLNAFGTLPPIEPLAENDPTLDDNPFYLAQQTWGPAHLTLPQDSRSEEPAIAFTTAAASFSLQLPESRQALAVEAPLHPIYATDDYIVLAANDPHVFDRTSSEGERGEGVFLIDTTEMTLASTRQARVPIYFVPLPDEHWSGRVQALGFPAQDLLVLADNTGETLPIQEDDLDMLVQWQRANLGLARAATLRSRFLDKAPSSADDFDLDSVVPLPKTTAGFGIRFTGYDPTHPDRSLFHKAKSAGLFRKASKLWDWFGIPSAMAASPAEEDLQKLETNLFRLVVMTGACLALAFVAKYTFFSGKLKRLHQQKGKPESLVQDAKDVGSLFGTFLYTQSYADIVGFGLSVRFFMDRYFYKLTYVKNGLVNRFFDETVYKYGRMCSGIAVDWRTVIQGISVGLTVGLVDGAMLYMVWPWLMTGLAAPTAGHVWPGVAAKISASYDRTNPDNFLFARNEFVRALAEGVETGAPAITEKRIVALMQAAEAEIETELARRLRIDRSDPRYEFEKTSRLMARIQEDLKNERLPTSQDFLLDFASVWEKGMSLLGYRLPRNLKTVNPEADAQTYMGLNKPGLLVPALKEALKEARARLRADPGNTDLQGEVQMLRYSYRHVGFLRNLVCFPTRTIAQVLAEGPDAHLKGPVAAALAEREDLIALTGADPIFASNAYLPHSWLLLGSKRSARLAAQRFRNAMTSIALSDSSVLKGPSKAQFQLVQRERDRLYREAAEMVAHSYPAEWMTELQGQQDSESVIFAVAARHPTEWKTLYQTKVVAAAKSAEEHGRPYVRRRGWVRSRQEKRAFDRSLLRFEQKYGAFGAKWDFENVSEDRRRFEELYAEELAHEIGLYPDYEAEPELKAKVEERARTLTALELKQPQIQNYLTGLPDDGARAQFAALLYAENFTAAHVQFTWNGGDTEGSSGSTNAPGVTQRLRQTPRVRNSKFLTRFCRGIDSLFSVESYRSGLKDALYRNIPFAFSLTKGAQQTGRVLLPLGANYWYTYLRYGVAPPFSLWALSMALYPVYSSASQTLNRLLRMQGLKTGKGWINPIIYGALFSVVTSIGSPAIQVFRKDAEDLTTVARTSVAQATSGVSREVTEAMNRCRRWIERLAESKAYAAEPGVKTDSPAVSQP